MNNLYIICGMSGVGKTTLINELCRRNRLTSLRSYTTRPQRSYLDTGHFFVTENEFDLIPDKILDFSFSHFRYCITNEQLNSADILGLPPNAFKDLLLNKQYIHKKIHLLYITVSEDIRYKRMLQRNDDNAWILQRMADEKPYFIDIEKYADKIIFNYNLEESLKEIETYIRNATTNRFSGKAKEYGSARPTYSSKILDIFKLLNINEHTYVADIGAGTGIFSKMLLDRKSTVFSIEPNKDMFKYAIKNLKVYPKSFVINATAENTTLPNKSIDIISAAQSFHWFDHINFRKECIRILKDNGKILLLWNVVNNNTPITQEIEKCIKTFNPNFHGLNAGIDINNIQYCIKIEHKYIYKNDLVYDKKTFRKRWLSSSFSPVLNSNIYESFIQKIDFIFDIFSQQNFVNIENNTIVYLGSLNY